MKTFLLFSAACFLILTSHDISAQPVQDSVVYRITTVDANQYTGTIVRQNAEILILRTESLGEIPIRMNDIQKIEKLTAKEAEEPLRPHYPQSSRYFLGSSAYNLRRGEAYYQNIWVMFNQFNVGITNNISIGGGLVPLFLFAGAPTPVWFTPKINIPVIEDQFHLGAGALIGTIIGEEEATYGYLYGLATFGSSDANATLGIGYGMAGGEWADLPAFTVSGMVQTGERMFLLTENYILSAEGETAGLIIIGGRRLIQRVGLDFGLIIPFGAGDEFIAIPLLGVSIPIGKR